MARFLAACGCSKKHGIAPYQELYISPKVYKRSVNVLRFAVFVDGTIEQPNYPIMVLPGAHVDSFPDTGGLGFSAATYMVPMSALLGVAIASMFIGMASDKVGRKPCMLLCLYGTVVGCILKYLFRFSFWPYCGFNFLNGLFSASVPVSLAYAGDVNETKREKDSEIGVLVGISMLGAAGGGIIAILMETQGLFVPLLVGAGIVLVAAVLNTIFLIEPKDIMASRQKEREELGLDDELEDDEDHVQPVDKMDWKVFSLIIGGALGDNVGSSGLMPLCLSPLAFERFYAFAPDPSNPIMSQVAYKWISVLVALMVVPGTLVSPFIYNKFGLAGGCIIGNVITGIVTIMLLYIALAPASTATFGIFVALLYACFPFTVISQLSTGPMLEATSPPEKRGLAQGVNITVMNFGAAVSPFILGTISDMAGTPVAIWICIAISFIAAFVNVPLIWVKGCNIPPKPRTDEMKPLKGEDKDLVEKALRGEWIPAQALEEIQEQRFNNKQPYLVVPTRSYAEERDKLQELRKRAKEDFIYYQQKNNEYLERINNESDVKGLCDQINQSMEGANQEEVDAFNAELGKWISDYLVDSGYHPHMDATFIKQVVTSSFPVVNKGNAPYHPLNIEKILLQTQKGYTRLIEMEGYDEGDEMRIGRILKNARSVIYMQSV
ncbi:hypothetical protein ACHAWC_010328 [Mediolabrus comicus]